MITTLRDNRGFLEALIGDGRPLLFFTGLSLILSGSFALFLSATGHFLPHDTAYLGQDAVGLCQVHGCRIVYFMFHDRVAFGGTLLAIGVMYLWLTAFPLRAGEAWAWWTFLLSTLVGFASFLTYLSYGYLDTWHGLATLFLLPCFVIGLFKTYSILIPPKSLRALAGVACVPAVEQARAEGVSAAGVRAEGVSAWQPSVKLSWRSAAGLGRILLLGAAFGMISAGLTIMTVGMSLIFVPQDLAFMGLTRADLHALSPRLIPLIAHDRAGFGGGLCSAGVAIFFSLWCGQPSKSLWQALALVGLAGFGCAIGIHFIVGYTDIIHLLPAYLGAGVYGVGLALSYRSMMIGTGE